MHPTHMTFDEILDTIVGKLLTWWTTYRLSVKFTKLDLRATTPTYAHEGDAGMDLHCILDHELHLEMGNSYVFSTGIAVEIPPGYEGQIRGRSGLNFKKDIVCPTGTIDAPYRGELCVKLYNNGHQTRRFKHGDRIAQIVFAPVMRANLIEVASLSDTERGEKGFGSSGQ